MPAASRSAAAEARPFVARYFGTRAALASLAARTVVLVLVTTAAYHYSVGSLYLGVDETRVLVYPGLAPFIAMGVAFVLARRLRSEPAIHDRQLDYILGLPLILGPLLIFLVLPSAVSTSFWLWRLDLLSLPLFVAGGVAILFGTRTLVRIIIPLALLLLAWPPPYRFFAQHVDLSPGGPCFGSQAVLGYLIVATALVVIGRGRGRSKLAWLASGLLLASGLSVALPSVFGLASGSRGGEVVCSSAPGAEYLIVVITTAVMGLLLSTFGVTLLSRSAASAREMQAFEPGGRPARSPTVGVRSVGLAIMLLAAVAVLMGFAGAQMDRYAPLLDASGWPKLSASEVPPSVPGGSWKLLIRNDQVGRRYFGTDSEWARYRYDRTSLLPPSTVFADVISSSHESRLSAGEAKDAGRLLAPGITPIKRVDLGAGVRGQMVVYRDQANAEWLALLWQLPVRREGHIGFQSFVLSVNTSARDAGQPPARLLTVAVMLGLDKATSDGPEREISSAPANFLSAFAERALRAFIDSAGEATR